MGLGGKGSASFASRFGDGGLDLILGAVAAPIRGPADGGGTGRGAIALGFGGGIAATGVDLCAGIRFGDAVGFSIGAFETPGRKGCGVAKGFLATDFFLAMRDDRVRKNTTLRGFGSALTPKSGVRSNTVSKALRIVTSAGDPPRE